MKCLIYYRCMLFSKYVLLGADGLNLDMLPTFFFFLLWFCSDPYVKLSLYVADETRELALVQTKTIKKVSP